MWGGALNSYCWDILNQYQDCGVTSVSPSSIHAGLMSGTNDFWTLVPGGTVGGSVTLDCCAEPSTISVCGNSNNTCDIGIVNPVSEGEWICAIGLSGGGTATVPCSGPVDGTCGTADNATDGCMDGTYQDETGAGWTCLGTGGGDDIMCGGCNWIPVYSVVTRHWRTGRNDLMPHIHFSYPVGTSAWNDLPTDINLFRSRFLQCEGTCPAGQFFLPDTVNGALSYQGGSCNSTLEIDCEASYLGLNNVSECSVRIPGHFSSCTFISDTSGSGSVNIQSYVDAGGNNVSTRFYNLESLEVTMTSPGVAELSCQ